MTSFPTAILILLTAANTTYVSAFASIARNMLGRNIATSINFESLPKPATVSTADPATIVEKLTIEKDEVLAESEEMGFSFGEFAKQYPCSSNVAIASTKTAAADLIAQVVIAQTPIANIDWDRTLLFFAFGAMYSGVFNYLYQVKIFKKLFDVDKFTSQPWADKLKDEEGLKALAAQTALDLTVLSLIFLPAFYVFKAGVFSGSMDPSIWTSTGLHAWQENFAKDEFDLIKVWFPADLICFSVPLYLRLPTRHIISFVYTAYLSFAHGAH